jgi:hypothetical protein
LVFLSSEKFICAAGKEIKEENNMYVYEKQQIAQTFSKQQITQSSIVLQ